MRFIIIVLFQNKPKMAAGIRLILDRSWESIAYSVYPIESKIVRSLIVDLEPVAVLNILQ